jgi:electron transfer flavoprotein alpha subunit
VGTDLAVRVGYRGGGSAVINVDRFQYRDGGTVVSKRVYSGNLEAEFEMLRKPYIIGVAKGAIPPEAISDFMPCEIVTQDLPPQPSDWLADVETESVLGDSAFDSSPVVVVGGRGVSSKDALAKLALLAKALNGVLGVTRPLVMNGWIDASQLVGMSGRTIHPDLCLAFGVSGSMPFIAGVQKSKMLIAINNDPTASIFKNCDVAVIEDLYPMVIELIRQLESTG